MVAFHLLGESLLVIPFVLIKFLSAFGGSDAPFEALLGQRGGNRGALGAAIPKDLR